MLLDYFASKAGMRTASKCIQQAVKRINDTKALKTHSRPYTSSFPVTTGWEYEETSEVRICNQQPWTPSLDYSTCFEGTLERELEMRRLGKVQTDTFCTFEKVVRAGTKAVQAVCHLCGRLKFMDELCHCTGGSIPSRGHCHSNGS